jgi:PQQ-dependent dehydrogenase (s-GDH family)
MKKPLLFLPLVLFLFLSSSSNAQTNVDAGRMNEVFRKWDLASGVQDPWELTYGPDGFLWYTEAKGYRVRRMNLTTGTTTTALDINSFGTTIFRRQYTPGSGGAVDPQGGLMGMAFHPQWNSPVDSNFVYLAYVHDYLGQNVADPRTGEVVQGRLFITWVTKWFWNGTTLTSPVRICDTIRGSNDHNSGRMIIAPDPLEGGQYFLYYASGDMGAGQFDNTARVNKAQWNNSYEGKILRFKLHGQGGTWVPTTNPLGVGSAIYAKGVRNNQGFAYDPVRNKLYGSSHGPFSDDEINIFEKGKNYGHPLVIGYKDDNNYNGSKAATPASILPMINIEKTNGDTMLNYKDPLFSAYPSTQANINNLYLTNPANGGWPSEGWTGMDFYNYSDIPGWKQSILIGSLKWGRVLRFKLDPNVDTVVSLGGQDTISYWGSQNRFRDVALDPDGKTLYVAMDNSTTSSGPSAANPIVPNCTGCIHKYVFLGYYDDGSGGLGASSIRNWIPIGNGIANSCAPLNQVRIHTDSSTTANNLWVPITDQEGNIIAEIRGNGQNLGNVTGFVYKNTAAVRKDGGGRPYLDRNIQISTQLTPGANVNVRLYLTQAEVATLAGTTGSMVTNAASLSVFKTTSGCGTNTWAGITKITPTRAAFGANHVFTFQTNSFSTFFFASNSFTTLPTELLEFSANLTAAKTVKVDWKTATEENISTYEVERSIDGQNFDVIGTITARNNGSTTNEYTFTDLNAANQPSMVLYYRLKVNDADMSFKNSKVVTVTLADIAGKVFATPNPTMGETKLTINAFNNDKGQWKIIDNSGRVVMQNAMQLRTGNNTISIDIKNLAAGMYYLDVKGGGITTRLKLQKL